MDERLKTTYTKLINKHYTAVQTDTLLGHTDNWKLENKSKQYWEDYRAVEQEFKALLEQCKLSEGD